MPHRGRLNLLTDLLQYSPAGLFHKIKGGSELPDDLGAEGDVLSHLGKKNFQCFFFWFLRQRVIHCCCFFFYPLAASPLLFYDGSSTPIKVSVLPNPSHLGKFSPYFVLQNLKKINNPKPQRLLTPLLLVKLEQNNMRFLNILLRIVNWVIG